MIAKLQQLFIDGGMILPIILILSSIMWWCIVQSYFLQKKLYPQLCERYVEQWLPWRTKTHRLALDIKAGLLSDCRLALTQYCHLIRVFTLILPLLGLLGTVDGMIETFSSITENSEIADGFPDGIAKALLTTLAGLVTGVSGIYFYHHLTKRANILTSKLAAKLQVDY